MSIFRSGVGAPRVGECDGDYYHDTRKNILEWRLSVIDEDNKTGSLEFSIPGQPDDFFPVNVNFVSKKSYCDIVVSSILSSVLAIKAFETELYTSALALGKKNGSKFHHLGANFFNTNTNV